MSRSFSSWFAAITILGLAACSDGPVVPETDTPAFTIISGADQTGLVGEELPEPLVIQATISRWGQTVALPYHIVTFHVVEGDGSVFAGTAQTDHQGHAREYWTLGPEPGLNRLEVRSIHVDWGDKLIHATFEATGVAGTPELCNGLDDNLDGVVDDPSWIYCVNGEPAPNTDGMTRCDPFQADDNALAADGCEGLTSWEALAPMPNPVRAAAVATDGSRIYVFGGNAGASSRAAHTQIFDPASGTWTSGAPIPRANEWGTAVYADGLFHLLGGNTSLSAPSSEHWIYDPVTDSWAGAPAIPARSAGSASAVVGRTIVLAGGIDGPGAYSGNVHLFDLDVGNWTAGQPVPLETTNWQGASVGGAFLAGGGLSPGRVTNSTLYSYDVELNTWTPLQTMLSANEGYGAAEVDGLYCVVGGRIGPSSGSFAPPFDRMDCYQPEAEGWLTGPVLPAPAEEIAASSVDGYFYAIGGRISFSGVTDAVYRIRP